MANLLQSAQAEQISADSGIPSVSLHQRGLVSVIATFAPAIGPTIGGYLTDNYGWPWIFYINLVPGAVMLAALWYGLPKSAMQFGLLRRGDWRGIALMAVGLATFQTVLDDGNVYDWFGSPFIVKLSLVAAATLVPLLMRRLDARLLGRVLN
jgi:DHA2 family multidrug resistance protein